MLMLFISYCILITTKNRTSNLETLMQSICKITIKPKQVVVVSTGTEVTTLIAKYREKLNITHIHSEQGGQTRQKKLGIAVIDPNIEWVLLSDDDVVFLPNTVNELCDFINSKQDASKIAGIGLSDVSIKPIRRKGFEKIGRFLFGLSEKMPGEVKKNSFNTNYMDSQDCIQTQWLNGISLWRKKYISNYDVDFDEVKHAYGEDLIFSYTQSKNADLYFHPLACYLTQNQHTNVNNRQLFYEKSYHYFYISRLFPEISIWLFYWMQIGRTCAFFYSNQKNFKTIIFGCNICLDILFLIFKKTTLKYILYKRINNLN